MNSGKVATASAAAKVAVEIATGAAVTCKIVAFDVSFDGTSSSATPILIELVKTTSASTGGSAGTDNIVSADTSRTAQSTSRVNDTTDGGSPTVLSGWLVHPQTGMSYQWPLGREPNVPVSAFWEFRITTVTGSGTPNYDMNVWVEE